MLYTLMTNVPVDYFWENVRHLCITLPLLFAVIYLISKEDDKEFQDKFNRTLFKIFAICKFAVIIAIRLIKLAVRKFLDWFLDDGKEKKEGEIIYVDFKRH